MLKISPLWKPDIQSFRHFPKLKIAYFNGKKILLISLKLNFTPNTFGLLWVNSAVGRGNKPVFQRGIRFTIWANNKLAKTRA